jgi:hypothetical protein
VGATGNFKVYALDHLYPAMRTDPRAWLLDPLTLGKPGYPKGPDLGTLRSGMATQATQRMEPTAVYTATYDCDNQIVRILWTGHEESDSLGYWGADPRSIEIAARYFCPNYSVAGVTFYKLDK